MKLKTFRFSLCGWLTVTELCILCERINGNITKCRIKKRTKKKRTEMLHTAEEYDRRRDQGQGTRNEYYHYHHWHIHIIMHEAQRQAPWQ